MLSSASGSCKLNGDFSCKTLRNLHRCASKLISAGRKNSVLSLYIFAHCIVNRGPLCIIPVKIIKNTREIFCIYKFYHAHHLWPLLYVQVSLSLSPILAFTPYVWYCISISLFPLIVFGGIQHVSRAQFSSPKPAHFPSSQLSQKTGLPQTHYCVSVHWMCIRAING